MAYQAPDIKELGSVADLTEWFRYFLNDKPNGSVMYSWKSDD